jgi:pSer/pThr/pTyr-binding forkhead associated (FHA) protein
MSDYLNSIHLEAPRREEFRRARSRLIDACGDQTRCVMDRRPDLDSSDSKTMLQSMEQRLPTGSEFALMNNDQIYPLKVGLNTIGRLPDNDVVIEDAYVSRRHCAILVHTGSESELHDVASKNGTFLNGSRLSGPTPLHSGDEIRMCDCHLVFVSKSRPHPGHAPTMAK